MKASITILRIVFLSCILLLTVVKTGFANENTARKINTHKKPTRTFKQHGMPSSLAAAVERQLNSIEKNIIDAAEAMPEDKFNFTPENLSISGSEFKGVRSFAAQIKHLATDNFSIWSPVTGDPLRSDITDVNGPENIKTKADIIKYLEESFRVGHKAIATLTDQNAMEMLAFRGRSLPRLDLVFYALTHSNEHYGQMVVYLRMEGIIPPATRSGQ